MDSVIESLWDFVDRDKRICGYFEGAKAKVIKTAITDYLIITLGGPGKYSGRPLEEVHQTVNVNDFHFNCFSQNLQRTIRDCGVSNEVVDEAVVCVDPLRRKILVAVYSMIK